jgi:hypothetical protein
VAIDQATANTLRIAAVQADAAAALVWSRHHQPGITKKETARLGTVTSELRHAADGARYLADTAAPKETP